MATNSLFSSLKELTQSPRMTKKTLDLVEREPSKINIGLEWSLWEGGDLSMRSGSIALNYIGYNKTDCELWRDYFEFKRPFNPLSRSDYNLHEIKRQHSCLNKQLELLVRNDIGVQIRLGNYLPPVIRSALESQKTSLDETKIYNSLEIIKKLTQINQGLDSFTTSNVA